MNGDDNHCSTINDVAVNRYAILDIIDNIYMNQTPKRIELFQFKFSLSRPEPNRQSSVLVRFGPTKNN